MADTDVITLSNLRTFKSKADEAYAGADEAKFSGTTTVALGGISKDTTYTDKPIKELLEELLIPYVQSTISAFSASPAFGVKESGTTVTLSSASVTISKGSQEASAHTISVASGSTSYGSLAAGSVKDGANTVTLSGSITSTTTLTATVNDGKNGSTKTGTYTFVDPYYYGVTSDISSVVGASSFPSGATKLVQSKGSKTITVSPTAQYIYFAFPSSYGSISSIKDGNGFENLGGFTNATQTMTVTSGSVSYKIYYTSDVKTASGFQLTFAH